MDSNLRFSILIVDDEKPDLIILNDILKSSYNIYFAKSGEAALKSAAENKPDIILLDIVMPDMDGFTVLSKLKKSDITCNIPVIFITGLNGVQDEEKGFTMGAVDYITKPFHSAIVKARISSHLKTITQTKDTGSVMLKTRQEVRNIFFSDLIYVDVSGHWLNFHLVNNEVIEVYATLKKYEEVLLVDRRFARCHKSFIVNMAFVEIVEVRDIVMRNNIRLPISKSYIGFKKQYIQWASE